MQVPITKFKTIAFSFQEYPDLTIQWMTATATTSVTVMNIQMRRISLIHCMTKMEETVRMLLVLEMPHKLYNSHKSE